MQLEVVLEEGLGGGGQIDGGQALCYTFSGRLEAMASDAVVIGIVTVCHRDAYALFDSGSTYSYVSSYFAPYLDMPRGSFDIVIHISMHVDDSIVIDRVSRSSVITIGGYETIVDLLLLNMAVLDVILGMDWLPPYYDIIDCHSKTMT
ncbi:uncharacterized protein [Nicotiana tomentosiformis]|uniref:uncharacterized protein n=1 Tax=Nicotiana tomentosiformis TaxID=4098 RepID=UPI00388C50F5